MGKVAAMNIVSVLLAGAAAEELLHGEHQTGDWQTSCLKDFVDASMMMAKIVS